jgi:predicted phage tail protein
MGKGGGNSEQRDTILTDSSVKLIDALCEGTIKGLVAGAKSIYLNKTPIQNSDNSYNFQAQGSASYTVGGNANSVPGLFSFAAVPGTNTQGAIAGFDAVQSEFPVGQEIRISTGSVTVGITTPDLDAIALTLAIPRLTVTDDEGNTNGTGLKFKIYLKVNSGLFVLQHEVTLNEKSAGGFEVQRTVLLPAVYSLIQLRVERVTADSTSDKLSNSLVWKAYTELQYDKYNYPNTALVAMEINSKVLQGSVKERRYLIDSQQIRIPTNAIVQADGSLIYFGAWNGDFTTPTWCADPAWCLYDLLLNTRYGADIPAIVLTRTKWDYYTASAWCNELVSDGLGGLEARFLLNVVLEQKVRAYDLIAQLAGVFGGIFFALGGGLSLATDRPLTPVTILSNENSKFNYQNSALRNRYTVALVGWRNPDLLGDPDLEVVEDPAGMALYGSREVRIEAIGCTRRSQARRFGLWYLLTSRLQADTLVVKTNIMAARLQPGEVVEVVDRNKQAFLIGRLVAATTSTFTLDQPVTLSVNQSWVIRYVVPDGTSESRILQPTGGLPVTVVDLVNPASAVPARESTWVIQSQTNPDPPQYQILAVLPTESKEWEITLVRYESTKWAQIAAGLTLTVPPVTTQPTQPNKPRNLTVSVISIPSAASATGISDRLSLAWDYPLLATGSPDPYTQSYLVSYRSVASSGFTSLGTSDRGLEIDNLPAGYYWVKVVAIDNLGRSSLDISTADPIPVGLVINASMQWSMVNSVIFLSSGVV